MKDALGYYEILELKADASAEEIKRNYRNIAKIWHPDQNKSEEALEKFQKLSVAYDVLKDDEKRTVYDLLSEIYDSENFPDMFALKSYKSKENKEEASVRGIAQKKMIAKGYNYSLKEDFEICDYPQAKKLVFKTSLFNWLFGWWSLKGFIVNLKTIIENLKNVDDEKKNLCLLVHNAVAYKEEKKYEKSLESVIEAAKYADKHQRELLHKFAATMNIKITKKKSPWSFMNLKSLQLVFPTVLALFVVVCLVGKSVDFGRLKRLILPTDKEINYYREVQHRYSGGRSIDDVLVGKIFEIPINITDDKALYHLARRAPVMYAPGDKFDIIKTLEKDTTVRITGYTPDQAWYRIMLDGGEMGFVRGDILKKGIGREIPSSSHIYKSPF